MSLENEKCVIVMDEGLPLGLIANTAAILGITLGKTLPEVVGAAVEDASGQSHLGIIEFPVPILRSTSEAIKVLRERLYLLEFQELTVVDFSDLAQSCKTYTEFAERMTQAPENSLNYLAVCRCCGDATISDFFDCAATTQSKNRVRDFKITHAVFDISAPFTGFHLLSNCSQTAKMAT